MSEFDSIAAKFERHRSVPVAATEQIVDALRSIIDPAIVRVLDLGAGSGRLGRTLVHGWSGYVGLDSSFAMLDQFRLSAKLTGDLTPSLVWGDGCHLPFRSGTFGAVLLAHVLSAAKNWRELLTESRRVLDAGGFVILAQRVAPSHGLDIQLLEQLRKILASMNIGMPEPGKVTREARSWLAEVSRSNQHLVAAGWKSDCTPRAFIVRHETGVRFSALSSEVQEESMCRLSDWAIGAFGSLDAVFTEEYRFELDAFQF
jgi:ubiquinone/menaquinone biosynthesis C-methylase UbiE